MTQVHLTPGTVHAWLDISAGVAGDMLLGAFVDAGAPPADVEAAVAAVIPGAVRFEVRRVSRAGLRATKVDVVLVDEDQPHRSWADIDAGLERADDLADGVRARAGRAFRLLAEAEGRAHGVPAAEVHFHEVGAWDSVADVVGVCAAVERLGIDRLTAGPVALGSGRVRAAHGSMPVPVPAVLELATGWEAVSGGDGELTTPTGMALVRALTEDCEPLPRLRVTGHGVGAGTRDPGGRANVVRVVLGRPSSETPAGTTDGPGTEAMWVLEANVDDLDPRVWPSVLGGLLDAGAADAWLTPIHMKKGRPAHVLSVLAETALRPVLRELVLRLTTTFGVREHAVRRYALGRAWRRVDLRGHPVRVKVSLDSAGLVVHATPELEDVAEVARVVGVPLREMLDAASAAATAAGLVPGADLPPDVPA